MSNVEKFKAIVHELYDIYKKKNSDYGDSFTQSCDEFGLIAPAIRITDKLSRFKNLLKSEVQVNESIEDTLKDLANYAIMTLIYMQKDDISCNETTTTI